MVKKFDQYITTSIEIENLTIKFTNSLESDNSIKEKLNLNTQENILLSREIYQNINRLDSEQYSKLVNELNSAYMNLHEQLTELSTQEQTEDVIKKIGSLKTRMSHFKKAVENFWIELPAISLTETKSDDPKR